VNLGARNKLSMHELRSLLTIEGWASASTVAQSGNIVLTDSAGPDDVARRIRLALRERFALDVPAIAMSLSSLRAMAEANPFKSEAARDPGSVRALMLFADPAADAVMRFSGRDFGEDRCRLVDRVVYVSYADGGSHSRVANSILLRHLQVDGTERNWRTVARVQERVRSLPTDDACPGSAGER
jgi:uncharacterized protein (DUF1697 family)